MKMPGDSSKITPLGDRVLAEAGARGLSDYLLDRPLVVGVSGGPDSLALLYLLYELRSPEARVRLHVAHLDHGFRGSKAHEDAHFVAETAGRLGLAVMVKQVDVPAYARERHLSAEDAARRVRYAFLAGIAARQSAAVAVAHTADDQAETVLLHLLRGSGTGGLAGMNPRSDTPVDPVAARRFDGDSLPKAVEIYRPLLSVYRAEIEDYCAALGLTPRTDASNADLRFRRNEIRHRLLPELERAVPGVKSRLARLADIARADDEALEVVAAAERARMTEYDPEARTISFELEGLQRMPEGVRRRVVRQAIELLAGTLEDVEFSHVLDVLDISMRTGGGQASVDLPYGLRAVRAGDRTVLLDRARAAGKELLDQIAQSPWPLLPPGCVQSLEVGRAYDLEGPWALSCSAGDPRNDPHCPGLLCALFDEAQLPGGPLYLRGRRQGDYIRPLGMSGRKSLQDLYVDAKIPGVLRDRVAVIALSPEGGEVLWVPGLGGRRSGIAPLADDTTRALRLQFSLRENT